MDRLPETTEIAIASGSTASAPISARDALPAAPLPSAVVRRLVAPLASDGKANVGQSHSTASFALLEKISIAAAKFSLELDSRRLFQLIAEEAADVLSAERVIVWSVVDGRLRRECWIPESDTDWPELASLSDEGLFAYRHLEAVVTKSEMGAAYGLRNAIFTPLIGTQNCVLGLIEVQNKRRGTFFGENDLPAARCLARVATSAVDRGRLFGRIEEWSRSIEMLLQFNATVNQQLQPHEMVRQLVIDAAGFIDADGGAAGIAIYTDVEAVMECDGLYFNATWHSFLRRWKSGEGVPGTVLKNEFPLLLDSYAQSPLADNELGTRFDIGSCICVPIKNAAGRVLGFFKLYRRVGKPVFTWQEAALLESLGNTVAVAIENARMVKSLERKNEQVKNLSASHVRQLELERQHIARELHDETGQVLIGLKLRLQLLSKNLLPEQTEARRDLDVLRQQVGDATVRLKELAKRLRPPMLDELGFKATVRQLIAEYRQQVDFDIHLSIRNEPNLSEEAETALYRILQESLTNVVKHSRSSNVEIVFGRSADHQMFMSIQDDGVGFDPKDHTAGLGLVGVRERVKMLGGSLALTSTKGRGTRLEIQRIPHAHQEESHPG